MALANPQPPESLRSVEGIAGMIPPEVAELRPEDLRVEAAFFGSLTERRLAAEGAGAGGVSEPDSLKLFPSVETPDVPAPWPSPEEVASAFAPPAPPETREPQALVPPVADIPPATARIDAVAPPIEIEAPALLKAVDAPRHIREVVMPASVVLMWSLFGLVGLAFSFIAGLMIGHFLWRS
jgi:hypothetical protein